MERLRMAAPIQTIPQADASPLTRDRLRTPRMYRVLLLNDDYTPMDFVVHVLQRFFQKEFSEATSIMLQVHHQGRGLCGSYPHEIAETKVHQVNQFARQNQYPLKCAMEPAPE